MSIKAIQIPPKMDISDSCNCSCCFPPSEQTTVYVNHKYEVEYFDEKKSEDHEKDHEKTAVRIDKFISNLNIDSPKIIYEKKEFTLEDIHFINNHISKCQ